MEYIFVLNPAAGKNRAALSLIPHIQKICSKHKISPRIYISQSGDDICEYVRNACADKQRRIYAVGGDGTLSRIINGCAGNENVRVGVIPMGTGNDFIRNFDISDKNFFDIEKQLFARTVRCDCIKYNSGLCINICNIGFDANVAVDMPRFKHLPLVSNNMAYNMSIVYNVAKKLGHKMEIYADGQLFFKGEVLMCAVANGIACGGGFKVAPLARTNDGLIDLSVVTPPSRLKLGRFVRHFSAGSQLDDKQMKKYVHYTRCQSVKIVSPAPINLVNDGEDEKMTESFFEIMPHKINFILPDKK